MDLEGIKDDWEAMSKLLHQHPAHLPPRRLPIQTEPSMRHPGDPVAAQHQR